MRPLSSWRGSRESLLGSVLIAAMLATSCQQPQGERPNVLIILADDLGYGSTNAYGADPRLVRTPNIDRLAAEGTRFTDAHAPSSICAPTRYALLTGRYRWRNERKALGWNSPLVIEPGRPTLATMFQAHGYQTAAVGKWHLGYGRVSPDYTGELKPGPLEVGFDYHFGLPHNHGDVPGVFIENHRVVGLRSRLPVPLRTRSYYGRQFLGLDAPQRTDTEVMEVLTQRALEWLERRDRTKPFFLYFAPVAVHEPVTPSTRTAGSSAAGPYGDWIHELDRSVGRLLGALDRAHLARDTLVLLTSDNGAVANHGLPPLLALVAAAREAGLRANGELRSGKNSVFQGGFRVPYLVRWPGRVPAGQVATDTIGLVDTFATLAALLGAEMPARDTGAEDSFDALPAWLGQKGRLPPRSSLVLHGGSGTFALRSGNWKWVEGRGAGTPAFDSGRVGPADELRPQLYDLGADPSEQHNIADLHPEVVADLAATLRRVREQSYSREPR